MGEFTASEGGLLRLLAEAAAGDRLWALQDAGDGVLSSLPFFVRFAGVRYRTMAGFYPRDQEITPQN